MFVNKCEVELLSTMGSDLTVVNTARVSFNKTSEYATKDGEFNLSEKDQKLITYLAKNGHWSPFAHCFLSFRIKAPVFVARQLVKHQIGLSWNEVSRRYVDEEVEFYYPEWRARAENLKQGSSDTLIPSWKVREPYEDVHELAKRAYEKLLDEGLAPELARLVLPQSMMTEWIWSGTLMAFTRVCKLRLDSHAQRETSEVAQKINAVGEKHFPHSWKALLEN